MNTESELTVEIESTQSETEPTKVENCEKSRKTRIINDIIYYASAPLASLIFFTIYLIYLNIYPYGDMMMSSYDMLAQIGPFGEHLFDFFEGKSSLFYSFSIAGGADTFGTLAYCFISPFNFLFLVGGKGMVNYMVPFVMGGKIVGIALSASFFVKKAFPKISPVIGAVLAILYTYSGYFHVANTYINWLDFMIYMPLVVLAFTRFMQTGKYVLFSASIAGMIYACFSIACFSLLIIFLILFAYVYLCVEKGQRKEKITKICLSLVLAVAFALPLILPAFMSYLHSGRNTGLFENLDNNLDALHLYRKVSYVLCDVVFFVLGVYYLTTCNYKKGLNKLLLVSTVLIFAPILVDEICNLLNAGSYMSYALRFGFLNSMLGLYLSCKALEDFKDEKVEKRYKWPLSCIIGVVFVALCAGAVYVMQDIVNKGSESFVFSLPILKEGTPLYKMFSESDFADGFSSKFAHSLGGLEIIIIMFAVFSICLSVGTVLTKLKVVPVKVAACILIAISLIQSGFNAYHMVAGNRNTMITYDQIQVVLDEIDKKEEDFSQFRIKDYDDVVTADAPFTLHYRSYSVFSSVIDGKNFVPTSYFQYTGNGINSMKSKGGNIFSDSLFGYKYAFSRKSSITSQNWKRVSEHKPFYLYENTCVFPTAFKIPGGEYTITDGNYAEQLNTLYNWLGGEGNLCEIVSPATVKYVEDEDYYRLSLNTAKCAGDIYYVAKFPDNVTVRYSAGSVYDANDNQLIGDDFKISKGYRKGYSTMSSVCLKATNGKIDEQTIKDCFKIATISYEKVKELYNVAWANAVDVDFNSNTIIGNTTAIDGEKLFVNYIAIDGYKCKINGNNAKLIDNPLGFLCVELDAGDNQLKLKYSSPYVTYILLGIVVATLFAVAVMLAFKHYTKVKKSIELIADWGADLLAAFIFGFGFCYPFFLFLVKLFKLIFKL